MKIFDKKRNEHSKEIREKEIIKKPRVCCLDLNAEDVDILKGDGLNLFQGTLGKKVNVPNINDYDSHNLLLNYDFPVNLHEYDVFILNLENSETIDYKGDDHKRKKLTGKSCIALHSTFPETLFDPRPLASYLLKDNLTKIKNRRYLIIVFATGNYEIEYEPIEIKSSRTSRREIKQYSIYSLFSYIPLKSPMVGKEMKTVEVIPDFKNLLDQHLDSAIYTQTFNQPTTWNNGEYIKDNEYFPLVLNQNEDIVSFYRNAPNFNLFILPQFKRKGAFLSEFLKEIAPSLQPELFPYSTKFSWKSDIDYRLPNEDILELERENIVTEYKEKLNVVDNKILENKAEYSFLHDIITETGDSLVISVIKYMKWLGFTEISDMDKENHSLKEEDIQAEIDEGLLTIEVKGIGGTSNDSDCSQISKIKHRRCEERNAFDVFALYLVNHQRYMPPLKRKNPPFTKTQIKDAVNDKRGLLSTWQLFKLYFDIQNNLITKEEGLADILNFGLIEFKPKNLIYIGEPEELFKNGTVCIVNISSIEIKIGDDIIVEKNGIYCKSAITGIMINNEHVANASNGEIGLQLSNPIKDKSMLWKKNNEA